MVVACENVFSSCENSLSNLDCFFFVFFFVSCFLESSELLLVVHGLALKSTNDCPKRALRTLLAVHFECCVTKTSIIRSVAAISFFLQIFKNSWPSLHNPPMLERMKGMQQLSVRRRPEASLWGYDFAFTSLAF